MPHCNRRRRGRELVVTAAPPTLAPDIADGLRRLKLAAMRHLAPELLQTAKTQRWAPEELLRTLIEAEITARDASNARTRLKSAAFPLLKTLDEFDRGVSTIPPATGQPGTYTLQLVLDQGAGEEVLTLHPDDADALQDLLVAQDTVHYDVKRRVLMFGVKKPGS
jgi:IstB-like ATP binding protein